MTEERIHEAAGGVWIGECSIGSCGRPATVRIVDEYITCSLHYVEFALGEEVDEMGLAVELMRGWKGQARHHHNDYLERLLHRAIEDCTVRQDEAQFLMSDVSRGLNDENVANERFRMSLTVQKDESRDVVKESNWLLTQANQLLDDAQFSGEEREELVRAKHAISEAGLIVSRMQGAATVAAPNPKEER